MRKVEWLIEGSLIAPGLAAGRRSESSFVHGLLGFGGEDSEKLAEFLGFTDDFVKVLMLVYERLPTAYANDWIVRCLRAVPIGSDVSQTAQSLLLATFFSPGPLNLLDMTDSHPPAAALAREAAAMVSSHQYRDGAEKLASRSEDLRNAIDTVSLAKQCPYRVQWALFSIEWMLINEIPNAIGCGVAAATGQLSTLELLWHRAARGYEGLCGAFPTFAGPVGWTYKNTRESNYQILAERLVLLLGSLDKCQPSKRSDSIESYALAVLNSRPAGDFRKVNAPAPLYIGKTVSSLARHLLLVATGRLLAALGWVTAVAGIALLFSERASFGTGLPWFRDISVILLCAALARALLLLGRRLSPGYGRYCAAQTRRPFVLYLRCFADDNAKGGSLWWRNPLLAMFVPALTPEEQLVKALTPFGKVVAVGRPGEALPAAGAARLYAANWESTVVGLMLRADLVVFHIGYGRGIREELSWARSIVDPRRVLVHIPGHRANEFVYYQGNDESTLYRTFVSDIYNGPRISDS